MWTEIAWVFWIIFVMSLATGFVLLASKLLMTGENSVLDDLDDLRAAEKELTAADVADEDWLP